MNNPYISAILAVTSLAFSAGALARNMPQREYSTDEKHDADYAVAKEKCDVFFGDDGEYCMSEAKRYYGK